MVPKCTVRSECNTFPFFSLFVFHSCMVLDQNQSHIRLLQQPETEAVKVKETHTHITAAQVILTFNEQHLDLSTPRDSLRNVIRPSSLNGHFLQKPESLGAGGQITRPRLRPSCCEARQRTTANHISGGQQGCASPQHQQHFLLLQAKHDPLVKL